MQFDETKPEPIVTPDTNNRTKLNPEDAPREPREDNSEMKPHFYRVLNLMNRGTHSRAGNNLYELWTDEKIMRISDNLAVYDAVSSQLDLPDHLKRWGRKLYGRLDLRAYRRQSEKGMGAVLAAIAVCAFVCKQNGWKTHPNHPDKQDELADLLENLGITDSEFRTVYGRVEQRYRPRLGHPM